MSKITTAILIKEDSMGNAPIDQYYINPLVNNGIPKESIIVLPLLYNTPTKILAKSAKAYLDKLFKKIPDSVINLIIADSHYFKFITNNTKVSNTYGTTVPGVHKSYDHFTCVYVPSHKSLFKQPENSKLIDIGINAISGKNNAAIINYAEYGFEFGSDREILDSLYKYPVLSVDIETTGLSLNDSIVSISFAWSEHDGVAIDLSITGPYYTKKFLENYKGKKIFHGGLFDAKLLIRNFWMDHETDYAGMMEGLQYFRDFDDTMVLTYLANNATTKVALGLKEIALEYVGNYAIEIKDITKYSKKQILQYNLIDTLATFYVWNKYKEQTKSRPYVEIFQPSLYTLLKMMLVGLPLNPTRVKEVRSTLTAKEKVLREQIKLNNHVINFTAVLQQDACNASNAKLKKLVKPLYDFSKVTFNPASHPQLGKLLFTELKLPIIERTKTKAASVAGDVLESLKNHTTDQDTLDLLDFLQELTDVTKINHTFIKAFTKERYFLHGNLKLCGAQSGRISSNSPNLTNLPAHGDMGKLTKSCIEASDGWLFAGADFSALEERIGAILSQDPNRIKVYKDGYDGHSMRTLKYFPDQLQDITAAINKAETATEFWIDNNGNYCCNG